jgi:glycosyltransferase involved in cell wall biosynthesis
MLSYLFWTVGIFAEALRSRPALIHVNDTKALKAASPVARVLRLPMILTVRDTKAQSESYPSHWLKATRICRKIITLSNEMSEILSAHIAVHVGTFCTVNSIVDLEEFRPASAEEKRALRTKLGVSSDEFSVLVAGAIRDKKNQLEFIERVLPKFLSEVVNAKVYFIGDFDPSSDPYARRCMSAAAPFGDRVVFKGYQKNIAEWCRAIDCIAIGARHEGLARAMIEGMACGAPIISFDVCSAREFLENTGAGLVIPQGDHLEFANALTAIAGSPSIRSAMTIAGFHAASTSFNRQRISAEWFKIYTEISALSGYGSRM